MIDRTTSYRSSIYIILTDQWSRPLNYKQAREPCILFKQIYAHAEGERPKLNLSPLNKKLGAIC